ncbi:MAG: hypothetical protein AB2L14_00720 [Candidatus Xenobiia bacterium LiM19]
MGRPNPCSQKKLITKRLITTKCSNATDTNARCLDARTAATSTPIISHSVQEAAVMQFRTSYVSVSVTTYGFCTSCTVLSSSLDRTTAHPSKPYCYAEIAETQRHMSKVGKKV